LGLVDKENVNSTYTLIILLNDKGDIKLSQELIINVEIQKEKYTSFLALAEYNYPIGAKYYISGRQKLGFPSRYRHFTPDELVKQKYIRPDLTVVHPDSAEGTLQRYVVLSYQSEKDQNIADKMLKANPNIISSSKPFPFKLSQIPSDPHYSRQWGLNGSGIGAQLHLEEAWNYTTGHTYIGVADTGIPLDSNGNILSSEFRNYRKQFSYDFHDNDQVPESLDLGGIRGHGTHVAGIIAAATNNEVGTSGICWDCSLAIGKTAVIPDQIGRIYHSFAGIGTPVVNSSFGSGDDFFPEDFCETQYSDYFCVTLRLMNHRDIMHSASSGNYPSGDGELGSRIDFPSSYSAAISVGAIDRNSVRAPFSKYGPLLDFVAPGVGILSTFNEGYNWVNSPPHLCGDAYNEFGETDPMDGYGSCTGTSMSAPHITGVLGLLRSTDPLLRSQEIKTALANSAQFPDVNNKDPELGHGVPNVALAIKKVLGTVTGNVIKNRLTPLFSFYNYNGGEDSFYTTVPQMAWPAFQGTLPPQSASGGVGYLSAYGSNVTHYLDYPGGQDLSPNSDPQPLAEVYIFTTKHNPITPSQKLVPLYRQSRQRINGSNDRNIDHSYASNRTSLDLFEEYLGYQKDGIEGYIYSTAFSQPVGTEKLYQLYNPSRDDHALFPESKLGTMSIAGYTESLIGDPVLGYVYLNEDSDGDTLIDGFERIIGTCLNNSDTDSDGVTDGVEVLVFPHTDPMPVDVNCGTNAGSRYVWQPDATGITHYDATWDYAMGYNFTPQVNGFIDQLGGLFNGTKTVKLFNRANGELLAQVDVENDNHWNYDDISPVLVQAGVEYTVAVYLAGSGASYQYPSINFPHVLNNITINSSTYALTRFNSDNRPINAISRPMFGQADVRFTPLSSPLPSEYTWQDNASGLLHANIPWDYTMGYHFTPIVDGTIDQLGGYFNGTKTVKLFDKETGDLLVQTDVMSDNNWRYRDIVPVAVQAGREYTVATYLAGSGGSYRTKMEFSFPQTFDHVRINGSTYAESNERPVNNHTRWMSGQSDIRFTPD